jgi:hypothetical protein
MGVLYIVYIMVRSELRERVILILVLILYSTVSMYRYCIPQKRLAAGGCGVGCGVGVVRVVAAIQGRVS